MFVSFMSGLVRSFRITFLLVITLAAASVAFGQAQSNAADLQGTLRDATGAVVTNATVTARNAFRDDERRRCVSHHQSAAGRL